MNGIKFGIFLGLWLVLGIAAPAYSCDICDWKSWFRSDAEEPAPKPQPQKLDVISDLAVSINLQNPYTRKIARCYNNNFSSAEECARYFEQLGFVRFRDIPYKTADYDFLHVDTFPTRRWRDSELTSRW